jgi:aminopeptidase N
MGASRNLTQSQALERARIVDVAHYDITLDLTDGRGGPGETAFPSRTVVRFACRDTSAALVVDVAALTLRAVRLNGDAIDVADWSPQSGALTLTGLRDDNVLEVEGDFAYTNSGQGLHRLVDPADGQVYVYSQLFLAHAPRVFACFDQPDLKAEFTWHVTVPAGWQAVSNMPVAAVQAQTVHFARSPRMSTYVAALCAGPLHAVRDRHNGVDLGVFCRESVAADLDAGGILQITKQGLDLYRDRFGMPYPLPKYDQVLLPEFNAGGMENFGCVTYTEELMIFRSQVTDADLELRAMVLLHELAHMWFGDLVTLRWWDDMWLNESFAEWAAYWACENATRFTEAWATFLATRKQWGYDQDQLSSTHPVYAPVADADSAIANFDGITYAKGASVIKQLVAYAGEDVFLAGLRAHFTAHAWGNATFDDLLDAVERAGGRELRTMSDGWLRTVDVNTLRPQVSVGGDGAYTRVEIRQEAPADHPTLRRHRVSVGLYDLADDALVRRSSLLVDVEGPVTVVPELAGVGQPDVLLVNDDDLTYAKVRLDPRSAATLVDHIAGFARPLQRALVWAGSWDMVKDAELAARDYVAQIAAGLPGETTVALLDAVLQTTWRAIGSYADPSWQPAGWAMLHAASDRAMRAAEPGGDRQLLWARMYAESARSAPQVAAVRAWLDGHAPEGLTVDIDLRWHLLRSLAAVGAVDSEAIDAELRRDDSAEGLRLAAWTRARLATAEAKAAAWDRMTGGSAPNWELESLLRGFNHPDQLDVLAPYADRYFAEVAEVCARLDGDLMHAFATAAFPRTQISERTVAAADEWLSNGHSPVLQRLVTEGRDRMVRALRARECDRSNGGSRAI